MSDDPAVHDCDICKAIREGCAQEESSPQNCLVCNNRGLIVTGDTALICQACGKGERMKIWVMHEKARNDHVEGISL